MATDVDHAVCLYTLNCFIMTRNRAMWQLTQLQLTVNIAIQRTRYRRNWWKLGHVRFTHCVTVNLQHLRLRTRPAWVFTEPINVHCAVHQFNGITECIEFVLSITRRADISIIEWCSDERRHERALIQHRATHFSAVCFRNSIARAKVSLSKHSWLVMIVKHYFYMVLSLCATLIFVVFKFSLRTTTDGFICIRLSFRHHTRRC